MKIDLQIHSNHSDGRETPEQLVQDANAGGLNVISITDHDIISAVSLTTKIATSVDIKVVPGVEITTGYRGQPIHILGYCIDIHNPEFVNFLNGINEYRKQYFISILPEINKKLISDKRKPVQLEEYKDKEAKYYSIPGVALFLYEQGSVEGRNDGFVYYLGLPDVTPNIEPKDAFLAIHKAGGKAFISHPFAPLISLKNITENKTEQESIVALFKEQGLDGLECYGTGHTPEDTTFALSLVEKYNLLISAGSDWHGCIQKTGPGLKRYLPFYLEKLGDLNVPEHHIKQILTGLGIEQ